MTEREQDSLRGNEELVTDISGRNGASGDSSGNVSRTRLDLTEQDVEPNELDVSALQLNAESPPWLPLVEDYNSSDDELENLNVSADNIVIQEVVRRQLLEDLPEQDALQDQNFEIILENVLDPDAQEQEEDIEPGSESEDEESDDDDGDDDILGGLRDRRQMNLPRLLLSAAEIFTTERIDETYSVRQRIREISSKYDNEKIHLNYQPGYIYSEPLDMRFLGAQNLDIIEFPSFRNNLAAASQLHGISILADGSTIKLYKVDEPSKILEQTFVYAFDTKPDSTTTHQIVGANWTNYPHYINYLTTGTFNGLEYLFTASDDGRVLIFDIAYLAKCHNNALKMNHTKNTDNRAPVTGTVTATGSFQMSASAWGLAVHERLHLLAVSYNTGQVTIFNIKELLQGESNMVQRYVSPYLRHNIPDVCFIDPSPDDVEKGLYREEAFYVACTSIQGDLVIWEFFTGDRLQRFYSETEAIEMHNSVRGLLEEGFEPAQMEFSDEKHDPMFLRVPFEGGRWMCLRNIEEEGWTVNMVSESDFKEVDTFYELSGSEWLNENNVFRQLSVPLHIKYPIPGLNRDEKGDKIEINQQFYDFAMRFVHFTISTTPVHEFDMQSRAEGQQPRNDQPALPLDKQRASLTEHYISSRNKVFTQNNLPSYTQALLKDPPLKNKFLLVTGKKSLYLCRAENLLSNASVNDVFRREIYVSPGASSFDRMNMVKIIPGLSAVVAVSQIGTVAIFRLIRYKSLFTLRQEYVFPVHEMLIHRTPILRAIVGVVVSPVYESNQKPSTTDIHSVKTHRLTIIYKDGFTLSYDLKRLDQGNLDDIIF